MKKIIGLIVLTFVSILGVSAATPIAVDDMVTINEWASIEINVLWNDTDVDNDTLMVTWILNTTNWISIITTSWTVRYTPSIDFNWTWSFDYIVSDWVLTDTWHVVITVNSVNDSPVAIDDTFTMTKNTTAVINVVWNDIDVDWDNLVITSLWNISNWTWVITTSWKSVTFTPNMDFVWNISFSYVVNDWVSMDTWTVTVTISSVNSSPIANDDKISTFRNTEKTFDPRTNDTDANWDTLTIIWKTNWTYGTVSFSSTQVTYKPDEDFYWNDSFTYTISDWNWWTDVWTVNITVTRTDYQDKPVQNIQKEFIDKFKELKNRYRNQMNSEEYKRLKKELRNEYFLKLKEVTGQWDQWESEEDEDEDEDEDDNNVKYKYQWNSAKEMYKDQFQVKYWSKISSLDDAKLNIVIWRIDILINTINSSNDYSALTKSKLNTMLLALRELILEEMDDSEWIIDIDSLFE